MKIVAAILDVLDGAAVAGTRQLFRVCSCAGFAIRPL
jgi:hypothetical protein